MKPAIDTTRLDAFPPTTGWFILNLSRDRLGDGSGRRTWCLFESPSAKSRKLGIGVHVLPPRRGAGLLPRGVRAGQSFLRAQWE